MRIHLPLLLFALVLSALTTNGNAAVQTIDSTTKNPSGDRWDFSATTEVSLLEDIFYSNTDYTYASSGYSGKGLMFNSSAAISFEGTLQASGAYSGLEINNNNISDHTSYGYCAGFIHSSRSGVNFANLRAISYTGNTTTYKSGINGHYGVFITSSGTSSYSGDITFDNIGDIRIDGNTSICNSTSTYNSYNTYLIYSSQGSVTFTDTNDISISGNNLTREGYLISMGRGGNLTFENTGNITIKGNTTDGIFSAQNGDILFANAGDITIQGNTGIGAKEYYGKKGAISLLAETKDISFTIVNSGNVSIMDNESEGIAGAVKMNLETYQDTVNMPSMILSADKGDIIFKGNLRYASKTPMLNSIYITDNCSNYSKPIYATLDLRAQENREIIFYDAIREEHYTNAKTLTQVDINSPADPATASTAYYGSDVPEFNGTIRFSGKYVKDYIKRDQISYESLDEYNTRLGNSYNSNLLASTTLYAGRMVIEEGAIYGAENPLTQYKNGFKTSFTLKEGTLEITGDSELNAAIFTIENSTAIIRAENTAKINTVESFLENGVTADLGFFARKDTDFGLRIEGNLMKLSGKLNLIDTLSGATSRATWNDFYSDKKWASAQKVLILDASSIPTLEGGFTSIETASTGNAAITSTDGYQGTWSFVWEDSNEDGQDDSLFALWTPKVITDTEDEKNNNPVQPPPVIQTVAPELEGAIVANSIWNSATNTRTIARSVRNQINDARFTIVKKSNYWVTGVGDFSNYDAKPGMDGYEYNGGGYVAGGDTRVTEDIVVGGSLGQIFGSSKSKLYSSKIDQDSMAATLYGAWRNALDKDSVNVLTLSASASLGHTSNKLETHYSDGDYSTGEWDNKTCFTTLKFDWIHQLGNNWSLSLFAGAEYTHSETDSFEETDHIGNKARAFDRASLHNLSLPIGIGFNKAIEFSNKVVWINSVSVSYVPDVYRENGSIDAIRLSNDQQWTTGGIRPSRQSFRTEYDANVYWNETWSSYASYGFEAAGDRKYHQVTLGMRAAF